MRCTFRALSYERRSAVRAALHKVARHTARTHGCEGAVVVTEGFAVTLNDARALTLDEMFARELVGEAGCRRLGQSSMGAEDFFYVLVNVPGAMFILAVAHDGSDWKNCFGIHSSRTLIDEAAIPNGSAFLACCALRSRERDWAKAR